MARTDQIQSRTLHPALTASTRSRLLTVVGAAVLAMSCAGGDGNSDSTSGALGSIDTSNNGYCQDYDEMCPDDALGSVKLEVCEDECTDGVKVAASSVRDSICWKTVCSLELGMCEEYTDDEQAAYDDALAACATRHGWYAE